MGPDEDHFNVTNNVYTNVIVKMGLEFARFDAIEDKCADTYLIYYYF